MMNDRMADAVARLGFRRWYERQLLSSHAHMVLTFLSAIALVAGVEAYRYADTAGRLLNAALILACIVIGVRSLRRYLFLLLRAETVARQAQCPDCGRYARFEVLGHRTTSGDMEVRCQGCGRCWTIDTAP